MLDKISGFLAYGSIIAGSAYLLVGGFILGAGGAL